MNWSTTTSTDGFPTGVAIDNVGNVVVTGISSGTSADCFTVAYDDDGIELWSRRKNSSTTGGSLDECYALAVDGTGTV